MRGWGVNVTQFNRIKRFVDIFVIVLLSPAVFVVTVGVAFTLLLKAGRPVLFRQQRVGLDGVMFEIVKFRSMTSQRDENGVLLPDAERLTAVGRWLRRTSLDEIPQLFNVLRGDMSLIGPRPLPAKYTNYYSNRESSRLTVRPGLTGKAQVAGRNSLGWQERLELDAQYVERRSLMQDISIAFNTFRAITSASGVSIIARDSGEPLDVERSYGGTEHVMLRRLVRSDLGTRVDWLSRPSTREHMQIGPISYASTQDWFDRVQNERGRFEFVLIERKSGRPLAMLGVKESGVIGDGEFYIVVDPSQRGRGFGQIASKLLFEWIEREKVFARIVLTVADGNIPGRQIYRELGFDTVRASGGRSWMSRTIERSEPSRAG